MDVKGHFLLIPRPRPLPPWLQSSDDHCCLLVSRIVPHQAQRPLFCETWTYLPSFFERLWRQTKHLNFCNYIRWFARFHCDSKGSPKFSSFIIDTEESQNISNERRSSWLGGRATSGTKGVERGVPGRGFEGRDPSSWLSLLWGSERYARQRGISCVLQSPPYSSGRPISRRRSLAALIGVSYLIRGKDPRGGSQRVNGKIRAFKRNSSSPEELLWVWVRPRRLRAWVRALISSF
jgi:hypothetical protein